MNKYIVYSTYLFASTGNTSSYGFSDSIHSNDIQSVVLDSIANTSLSIKFGGVGGFPFLGINNVGWRANIFGVLVNIVTFDSTTGSTDSVEPIPNGW